MPMSELLALLLFATALSFTPGPNTTLSAALAANGGLAAAMRFVCAVPVGWGLLLLSCALGLGGLLSAWPGLRRAVQWAGLAYMAWLAWRLWHAGSPAAAAVPALRVGFWQGVALQFVNVKAWLNALIINAGWITVAEGSAHAAALRMAWVLPLMMAFGFASNLSYALIGSALRRWLAHGRRLQWFNRVLALLLLATGVWMLRL
jgi:threonine/homoserine/homoserine lactone efflux protein